MKCPICGAETASKVCTHCGNDFSDFLRPVIKKKKYLPFWMAGVILVLGLVIWIGLRFVAKPWESHILRYETIEDLNGDGEKDEADAFISPVFGSEYRREQIRSVTVLDTLRGAPKDAWDVSEAGDGSVIAWVIPNGELYDLYLAGNGGISAGPNAHALFAGYKNASGINLGKSFHTEGTEDMSHMFYYCERLYDLYVGGFNTSNVESMKSMFCGCKTLQMLDIFSFNTENVTDMNYMFYGCEELKDLSIGKLNTSNVKSMRSMFCNCEQLETLDISSFDTKNVTDMSYMFYGCEELKDLIIGELNTSNVESMECMFDNCKKLETLDISSFNTENVTDMSYMFYGCEALNDLTIGELNTSNVESMECMFDNCKKLETLDISSFNTEKVTDMSRMFYGCEALNDLTIGELNTSNVKNMRSMFYGCEKLKTLNLSSFDTANVTDMRYMFYNCFALKNLNRGDRFVTDQADTTKMMYGVGESKYDNTAWQNNILGSFMLNDADANGTYTVEEEMNSSVLGSKYCREQICSITILDTLEDAPENAWDVSEAKNGKVMAWVTPNGGLYDLYIAGEGGVSSGKDPSHMFAGYANATKINFGNAFHTDEAESMLGMFSGCIALEKLVLSEFVTSNVTNMGFMFNSCESLTELTLGEGFDTSNVQSMTQMFCCCKELATLKLSGFNTANVTNMSYLFNNCKLLNNLTLGEQFDTAKVENMKQMFNSCENLETLDLSKFDTSLVTDMSWMFANCTKLDDLTLGDGFIVGDDTNTESMYLNCPAGVPRWKSNVLKCYPVLDTDGSGGISIEEVAATSVFGSSYRRELISSITVLDSLVNAPEDAWDVSDDESGNVMAWVTKNGEMYDLYLAGEGGISIAGNTYCLFAGYTNAVSISLGEAFHTDGAESLNSMFYGCKSLEELELTFFDTASVQNMDFMFGYCKKLSDLTLGDKFVTTNAVTNNMFYDCPAGEDYTHLVH